MEGKKELIKYRPSERGSILMVLLIGMIAVGVLSSYFSQTIVNVAHGIGWSEKKTQTSYEAENLARVTMKLVQQYVENNKNLVQADLVAYVQPQVLSLVPSQYTLDTFVLTVDPVASVGTIDSGPFTGMQADSRTVDVHIVLVRNNSNIRSEVRLEAVVAGISYLQFAQFSFRTLKQSDDLSSITTVGRVHANKDICLGAQPWRVSRATAAGRVLNPHDPACWNAAPPALGTTLEVATDDTLSSYVEVKQTGDSGCLNCNGTGTRWAQFAINTWNGRVQDKAHNVPKLTLKVGDGAKVQSFPGATWNFDERILADPVLPSEGASRLSKFAYKADIRIVNGVWYLKDPSDPDNFPGIPVWSDHPGRFTTWDEEGIEGTQAVGQEDIRDRWALTPNAWPAGTVPKAYSYYEFDPLTNQLASDTRGIVSYGNLARDTSASLIEWVPGYYADNAGAYRGALCQSPAFCTNCAGDDQLRNALDPSEDVNCNSGPNPSRGALYLNATRSGFRDGALEASSLPVSERVQRSKILTMNFDIAAFQEALDCDPTSPTYHPGEIGCFFGGPTSFMMRPFNGIVYITNTWEGSLQGLTSPGDPVRPPLAHTGGDGVFPVGSNQDALQAPLSHPALQQALPFHLCSTKGGGAYEFAEKPYDTNDPSTALFTIPDCERYRQSHTPTGEVIRARPSAIRVVNGQSLDSSVLNQGLTLATNLKFYASGDLNSGSDTSSASATPWLPAYFIGDQTTLMSNNWEDDKARWDAPRSTLTRDATPTTYNIALSPAVFQFMEDWTGVTRTYRGPVVKTHVPVYEQLDFPIPSGSSTWKVGPIDEAYDPHYEILSNQPPGMPLITVFAIKTWARK